MTRIILFLFTGLLLGCQAPAPLNVDAATTPRPSPTATLISAATEPGAPPSPTATWPPATATQAAAPRPTATATPVEIAPLATATLAPGPPLAFWYRRDGAMYRYDLRTGTAELAPVPVDGAVSDAALSRTGRWLAYVDDTGLKYVALGADSSTLLSGQVGRFRGDNLAFSADEQRLAYADDVGLFVADLNTGATTLLWAHEVEGLYDDVASVRVYKPLGWSADGSWLTVRIGYWEGMSLAIGNAATGVMRPLTGCSGTAWSPAAVLLAMVVRYDGYNGCGGANDGVYVVTPGSTGLIETPVYQETLPDTNLGMIGARDVSWSPAGDAILFVQEEDDGPAARLLLVAPAGGPARELATTEAGRILRPIWAADGQHVYYALSTADNTVFYEVDVTAGERRQLWQTPLLAVPAALAPDGSWLALLDEVPNLILFDVQSGATRRMSVDNYDSLIGWQAVSP